MADNGHCMQLKVLVYGPGCLPVIVDGVNRSGLNLSSLLKLHEHGLLLDRPVSAQDNAQSGELIVSCYLQSLRQDT